MLRLPRKIICPFCFEAFGERELYYRCSNFGCQQEASDEVKDKVANRNGVAPRHIIAHPKVKKGYCECDKCKRTTSTKVCPECIHDLPDNILESPTKIISIVGAKGSGKSYYVATILRKIMEEGIFASSLGASCKWLTGCGESYVTRFKDSLDRRRLLEGTRPTSDLINDYPPLLIEMMRSVNGKMASNTFSFFDAAGESFEDAAVLSQIAPYLGHSIAVLVILYLFSFAKTAAFVLSNIDFIYTDIATDKERYKDRLTDYYDKLCELDDGSKYSDVIECLIEMLSYNPEERPEMNELLEKIH